MRAAIDIPGEIPVLSRFSRRPSVFSTSSLKFARLFFARGRKISLLRLPRFRTPILTGCFDMTAYDFADFSFLHDGTRPRGGLSLQPSGVLFKHYLAHSEPR